MAVACCIMAFAMSAAAQMNTFPASGSVGIGTQEPRSLIDVNGGTGVNQGMRLGSYWEFGTTAFMNEAYWSINAVLTTSSIPNSTNYFSPIYPGDAGMVMTQEAGGIRWSR